MSRTLNRDQAMRYNRQILMPGFDLDRQEQLMNSHALMIGAGGLGCACSQYLVASGLGHLSLMDGDVVELTNLPRQVLHSDKDIGRAKVESAQESLQILNPNARISTLKQRFNGDLQEIIADKIDLVIDCSDNLSTRNHINQMCFKHGLPLVSGAAIRMEGQITSFIPKDPTSPCYQCISSYFGEQNLSCVESGILSPVVGVIGAMQALEAVKLLTDYGQPLAGKLLLFDAMSCEWQTIKVPKRSDCPVCAA
ncbi:MAG: molybdopterin-synthase adenylyltransferase MoeB [Aestuariibacter sp.]